MNKRVLFRILYALIFLISSASLIISLRLFSNMAVFADENNITPASMVGGSFWNNMDWLRLVLLAAVCVISAIGFCKMGKKGS